MLKRHYNSREILNTSETIVDGLLSDLIYEKHNWHSIFGFLLTRNSFHKTGRGECDFILICELGVLVVEVKGGFITVKENKIFQKDINSDSERPIDPFTQVRGNVQSIINILKEKVKLNVFVGESVIFPQSSFNYSGQSFKHYWHIDSKISLSEFLLNTLKKQRKIFAYELLKAKEILEIVKALSSDVKIEDRHLKIKHSIAETKIRSEQNFKILKGLEGNCRILIEGPPGSGKSTYAKNVILDKVTNSNISVLYLCWNNFLAIHMNQYFVNNGVGNQVLVMPYFDYINYLVTLLPNNEPALSYDKIPKLYDPVQKLIVDLQSIVNLPKYDLIVIDEAQDLFDKGIDQILDNQMKNSKNGLTKGNYIIFYDYLQAFNQGNNPELYQLIYLTVKDYSAYYKLYDSFRAIEGSGIANFLDEAVSGSIDLNKNYGIDMIIKKYNDDIDCVKIIKQEIKDSVYLEKISKDEIVVLFSSNIISGNITAGKAKEMNTLLENDSAFEKIDNQNINHQSEKIRYTTSLKFKGLEKNLVIVVIKDLYDENIKTFYQMYMGVSRAKAKVVLLINN